MPEKSFEARLTAIEAQMAGKTLETHFREQAELIDRLFIYRFAEFDKKWDEKLAAGLERFDKKWDDKLAAALEKFDKKWDDKLAAGLAGLEERIDVKLEARLEPLRTDIRRLTDAVLVLVARLP